MLLLLEHDFPFRGSSAAIRFVKSFLFLIYSFCLHRQVFWIPLPQQVEMDGFSSSLSVCFQDFGSVSTK